NDLGPSANPIALSPDAKILAAREEQNAVLMWDVATGKRLLDFADAHTGHIDSATYSPNGRQIITGGREGTVRLWDALAAKPLRAYPLKKVDDKFHVRGAVAAFSPDGKWIAAGGYEYRPGRRVGLCRIWDRATSKEVGAKELPQGLHLLAFSPDSKRLAIAMQGPSGT